MNPGRTWRLVLILILIHLITQAAAQVPDPFVVQFTDSVSSQNGSPFVYNVIRIQNKTGVPLDFQILVSPSDGWKPISDSINHLTLLPGKTGVTPITLIRQPGASAGWTPIVLEIVQEKIRKKYRFFAFTPAVSQFSIRPVNERIQVGYNEQSVTPSVNIRNLGTTRGVYTLRFKNYYLELNHQSVLSIDPGRDSICAFTIKLPEKAWATGTQKLLVEVADTEGTSYSFAIDLFRVQSELKKHPSPYSTFPFEIESGVMKLDKELSYYGAFNGEMAIGKNRLLFSYRSKMYGIRNKLEKNIYTINYKTPKWDLAAGQMSEAKDFFINGRGASVSHRFNGNIQAGLRAVKHGDSLFFTNDNYSAFVNYPIKNSLVSHTFSADLDGKRQLNGYILKNDVMLLKKKNIHLSANAAIGFEQLLNPAAVAKNKAALAIGYALYAQRKHLSLSSILQHNSNNLPGINKGLRMHYHSLKWQNEKFFAEAFYQSNRSVTRYFRDTLYNSDILAYNVEKYGIRGGKNTEKQKIMASTGRLRQTGSSFALLPAYQFLEVEYTLQTRKDIRVQISTINGYTASYGPADKSIFFSTSSGSVNLKHGGLKGFYIQTPVFDQTQSKNFTRYNKTLLAAPYAKFNYKGILKASLQLNVSKSLYDRQISTGSGFDISYFNRRSNFNITLMGMIPFRASQAPDNPGLSTRYVSVYLRKRFNVPVITKKRYHNLSVIPFFDMNSNGKKDKGEQAIDSIQVNIDDVAFLTNASGTAIYRNMDTGSHRIDLTYARGLKGLVPAAGLQQGLQLYNSTRLDIPFRKSKVIFGKISVSLDSRSFTRFSPANIRVMATDAAGKQYTVLSGKDGEYFLNVPAGQYTVSLNPEAFSQTIKPVNMAFRVDLTEKDEAEILFEITEKKREIRFLDQGQ